MSEAEILEMTYDCTCKIIRKVSVKDLATGITNHSDLVIADNVKCSVSKRDSVSNVVSGEIGSIVSTNKLFANPNVNVTTGDTIEVTNQIGDKSIYLANEPTYYVSHKEISITKKDRV